MSTHIRGFTRSTQGVLILKIDQHIFIPNVFRCSMCWFFVLHIYLANMKRYTAAEYNYTLIQKSRCTPLWGVSEGERKSPTQKHLDN